MIADYFKQLAFYAVAWHERTGEGIDDIVVVMAVEKSPIPLIFKEKLENWISPLVTSIVAFENR